MITITFYGLDQFVVGRLSRELGPLVAKLYEVKEDDVNFIASNSMVFHNGTEQTSWNLIITVDAPMKVSVLQDQMSQLITKGIGEVAINKTVYFRYFSQDHYVTDFNEAYPRYITEDNLVNVEEENYSDDELEEGEEEDQIYTGDIFKDFSSK